MVSMSYFHHNVQSGTKTLSASIKNAIFSITKLTITTLYAEYHNSALHYAESRYAEWADDECCCAEHIDIKSFPNRLLKVCYVPATSASLPRVLFIYFCCSD